MDIMKKPEGYQGPDIEVIVKDSKMAEDDLQTLVKKMLSDNLPSACKVGIF